MGISAGVYSHELDLSLFAETTVPTIFGLIGTFKKGVIGEEILISNIDNLVTTVGTPLDPTTIADPQGFYAGREFLRRGNQLKVVRVESAASPALYSATSLIGGSDDTLASGTDGATSIPATRELTSAGSNFVTSGVLAGDIVELSDTLSAADNGFYVVVTVAATVLTVDRNWPTGSLASLSFTVWSGQIEGGVDGATSIPATRTFTSAGSTFTTNGVEAGHILKVHDPAGASPEDNGVYVITAVGSQTQLTVNRDWPSGSGATLEFTVYGPTSSGSNGDCSVDGAFTSVGAEFADHGVVAGDLLYIKDAVDSDNNGYYVITGSVTATSFAVAYNRTWPAALTSLDYEIWPGSVMLKAQTKGTWATDYIVKTIRNAGDINKVDVTVWDSSTEFMQERVFACDRSNITDQDDLSAFYDATVISNRTEPVAGNWALSASIPPRLEVSFNGGDDGTTGIIAADYITSLAVLANPELTDIDIMAIPGQSGQAVVLALIAFAESRGDCLALIDPPDSPTVATVQEILNWHNGSNILTTALNSSYAALYWGWQPVYDEYNAEEVQTAPSGHAAAVMAHTDRIAQPWYAPSGFKRGKVIGSLGPDISPTQDDRDSLQSGTNCVNPIVNFTAQGVHIFGQKTLLRASSALNRVNIRRLLLRVKKTVANAVRTLTFEPNDDVLFREFQQIVGPYLDYVQAQRGINEFMIINATSALDRDNVTFRARVYIKPTTAAERILLEYVLTSQTTDFAEMISAA